MTPALNTTLDDAAGTRHVVTALVIALSCDPLVGSQSPSRSSDSRP